MKGSGRTLLWQALGGWGATLPEVPRHLMSGLYMAQVGQPEHRSPCLGRQVWRQWGCAVIVGVRKDRIDESNGRSEGVVTVGGDGDGVVVVVVVVECNPEMSSIENATTDSSAAAIAGSLTLLGIVIISRFARPCVT